MAVDALAITPPSVAQSWTYAPVSSPVLNDDPSLAQSVGIGPLSSGGNTLSVKIGLNQFDTPVNIYGAYRESTNPGQIKVLKPGGASL